MGRNRRRHERAVVGVLAVLLMAVRANQAHPGRYHPGNYHSHRFITERAGRGYAYGEKKPDAGARRGRAEGAVLL